MAVLQSLLEKKTPKISSKNELTGYVDGTLYGLLDKIGDNNARIRENAETCFLLMVKNPAISCNLCVTTLIKNVASGKHKTTTSTKHVLAKLGLLRQIIKEFSINNADVPFSPVVEYVVKYLENSNVDIRTASFNLVVDIYQIIGPKLKGLLSSVRPTQMEMLQKEFDSIEGVDQHAGGQEEQETVVTTNINPHGNKGTKAVAKKESKKDTKGANSNKGPSSGDAASATVCEFCGKTDRNFTDSAKMDIHLWKECPMLTTCNLCAQVVEIASLNSHFLEECDQKKSQRKCPRCKEAVSTSDYKQHIEEMSCLPSQPGNVSNRCPLCHQDAPPGPQGWKRHLVSEGCPNNERTI